MQSRKAKKQELQKKLPLSEPLTRTPIPPKQSQFGSTPAWLYSAILGNGHLLVCLDEAGSIAQLFYPYIDSGPNVRSFFSGIQIGEHAQQDDTIYWLAGEGWRYELHYIDGAATLSMIAVHTGIGLRVEQTMAVYPDKDVCLSEIKLTNERATPIDCRLVTYASFDMNHRMSGNTCFFDNETSLLTFFASDCYVSIMCDAPVDGFACEKASLVGTDHVFEKASCGRFSGREYAIGQVSGAIRHDFGRIDGGSTTVGHMKLCFGRSLDEVVALSKSMAAKLSKIEEVTTWWRRQFAHVQLEAGSPVARHVYDRSLITLRLLTDGGTGGIVAAPECDPDYRFCGGYGACWPRDGAFIAHALDIAGQYNHARMFYDWALRVQPESGVWYQRYHVNGQLAPTWGLVQFDETGAVVWAICRHVQFTGDSAYGQKAFPQLKRACEYMQVALDAETGLAPITKDLWEERDGISTYACASTWAGFHEFSELALKLGEIEEAERWAAAATRLKSAIETHLWDTSKGRFLRGIMAKIYPRDIERLRREPGFSEEEVLETELAGKSRYFRRKDTTIDVSILGLSIPFGVFSPDDPRILASAEAVFTYLSSPVGGIRRYEDDHYRGGNPWVICTLWLALQDLAAGKKERALEFYNWVLEHRTQLDLLPEQVDRAGKPCWIVPLGWSHAMFILATQALCGQRLLQG